MSARPGVRLAKGFRPAVLCAPFLFLGTAVACRDATPPPRGSGNNQRFGVSLGFGNSGNELAAAFGMARLIGVGLVRVHVRTNIVQPNRGRFNWAWIDSVVMAARTHGLDPVLVLRESPRWNTSAPDSLLESPPLCPGNVFSRYPPKNEADWLIHVATAVERYRGQVSYWEIWNEPDLDGVVVEGGSCPLLYWCGTPAQYARLLALTAMEIRRRDPAATVILGGLALAGRGNTRFLLDILGDRAYPAAEYFDVVNFHFYRDTGEVEAVFSEVRSFLRGTNAEVAPIWVTEVGYADGGTAEGQSKQSDYAASVVGRLVAAGASKIFWHRLMDPPPSNGPCSNGSVAGFGLMNGALEPKPAFHSFGTAIREASEIRE